MLEQTAITTDSPSDLSPALYERFGITAVPYQITLGMTHHLDGVDVRPSMLYDYVKETGELPKSAAPTEQQYKEVFARFADAGREVVHVSLSSGLSSGNANAMLAAKHFAHVRVVDSRSLSTGIGHLAIRGAEYAAEGRGAEDIAARLREDAERIEASFFIDTLEYLHKGGRCSTVAALGANLLHLKPCIEVADGGMRVGKKYRGAYAQVMSHYLHDRLDGRSDIDPRRAFITHTVDDPEMVAHAVQITKECYPFEEVFSTFAGSTIATHCGPGTLGVLFLRMPTA